MLEPGESRARKPTSKAVQKRVALARLCGVLRYPRLVLTPEERSIIEKVFGQCPEMLRLTLEMAEEHGLAFLKEQLFKAETEILRMQWEREKLQGRRPGLPGGDD